MFATYDGAGDIITLDGKISTAENVVHVLKYMKWKILSTEGMIFTVRLHE